VASSWRWARHDAMVAGAGQGDTMNREGFYAVYYGTGAAGAADNGMAVLVLDTGLVVGCGPNGTTYDGTYEFNSATGLLDATVVMRLAQGTALVTGSAASCRDDQGIPSSGPGREDTGFHRHSGRQDRCRLPQVERLPGLRAACEHYPETTATLYQGKLCCDANVFATVSASA
jgi:hypothetical protein